MLATSWNAKGLVRPIWRRLDVPTYKREKLAELTGIPASNLSSLNTGGMPMTMEMATRIANAVPGVTVLDLGAREAGEEEEVVSALALLDELAASLAEAVREQSRMNDRVRRLQARIRTLEARPSPAADPPKDQAQP